MEDFSMMTEERLEQAINIKNEMINEKNHRIVTLEMEVERLRSELGYIANAKRRNIPVAEDFRDWAQSRARHALGQKPGELTVKKT
jgi:hypothetical protein